MNTSINIIAIQALPGVGPKTARSLIHFLSQAGEEQEFIERVICKQSSVRRLQKLTRDSIQRAYADAREVLRQCIDRDISIHTMLDSSSPERLAALEDAPTVLFSRGRLDALQKERLVAIVGTRKPSSHGTAQASRIASHFAKHGVPVVSGLALGCDIVAHRACNELQRPSVAVLAHGLDSIHPTAHRKDAEAILESGGCWVSEYPPEAAVRPHQFVARNRLQIGLSDALIVIETNVEGGTMHTAKFAVRQGKPIAAVAHPDDLSAIDQAQGNRLLLSKGARAITQHESPNVIFEKVSHQGQLF